MPAFRLHVEYEDGNQFVIAGRDVHDITARYIDLMARLGQTSVAQAQPADTTSPPDPWAPDRNDYPGEAAAYRQGAPDVAPSQAAPGWPLTGNRAHPATGTQPDPTQSQSGYPPQTGQPVAQGQPYAQPQPAQNQNYPNPGQQQGPNPGYAPNAAPQYPPQQSYAQPAQNASGQNGPPMCKHGPMKFVQGGISKNSGNAYPPFYACPTPRNAPDKCQSITVG